MSSAKHEMAMRIKVFLTVLLACGTMALRADEEFQVLQIGADTYTNVTITKVTATDIFFFHAGGMGNAKLKTLSPELQKHFHYNAGNAAQAEAKQADNNVRYNVAAARQRAILPHPADAREIASPASAEKAVWRNDFDGALKQAQAENKLVLLDFTGSDWCPWCIKFDHEVLSTPKFAAYAGEKLELVKVDFPRHTLLPPDQQKANDALAKKFNVDGYPTYVLLTPAGTEIDRQGGYLEGGPDAFIAELERFSRERR